jgi:hypothetical protein
MAAGFFSLQRTLTEYAFDTNMELGMLTTGGELPRQVEATFDRLIATGMLTAV